MTSEAPQPASSPTLVSVCIPAHNGAAHLPACLDSLVHQSGVELEIVLRDDASSDGSLELAEKFAEGAKAEFPHVRWNIAANPNPAGMVANWNACLRACSGEYVKMMGQDDVLHPDCLDRQVRALQQNPEAALCISAVDILSNGGRRLLTRRRRWAEGVHDAGSIIAEALRRAYNPLGEPVAGLARRADMLRRGGYDESFRYWVDVEMWFQLLDLGSCVVLHEPLAAFRIHQGAASFQLQGDSYEEFRRIAGRCGSQFEFREPGLRTRARALLDSMGRLVLYKIFG